MPTFNTDLTSILTFFTSSFMTFIQSDLVKNLWAQFVASLPGIKEKLPLVAEYTKELFS